MVLNPRLRQCTFQHQVSDMKMLILVLFKLTVAKCLSPFNSNFLEVYWPTIWRTIVR
jgi:hypothetical protein